MNQHACHAEARPREGGLKAFEIPPLHTPRIAPAGTLAVITACMDHGLPLLQALQNRPRDLIDGIAHIPGLPVQLRQLQTAIASTLRDIDPRPASDPLPPSPKPQPEIENHK